MPTPLTLFMLNVTLLLCEVATQLSVSRIYRKADFIRDEIGFLYYALKVPSQTKIISLWPRRD